tara:strand:+ start:99 stop:254 length:156 start_codon:yes stop_codon:yes gene_type:complete
MRDIINVSVDEDGVIHVVAERGETWDRVRRHLAALGVEAQGMPTLAFHTCG